MRWAPDAVSGHAVPSARAVVRPGTSSGSTTSRAFDTQEMAEAIPVLFPEVEPVGGA